MDILISDKSNKYRSAISMRFSVFFFHSLQANAGITSRLVKDGLFPKSPKSTKHKSLYHLTVSDA